MSNDSATWIQNSIVLEFAARDLVLLVSILLTAIGAITIGAASPVRSGPSQSSVLLGCFVVSLVAGACAFEILPIGDLRLDEPFANQCQHLELEGIDDLFPPQRDEMRWPHRMILTLAAHRTIAIWVWGALSLGSLLSLMRLSRSAFPASYSAPNWRSKVPIQRTKVLPWLSAGFVVVALATATWRFWRPGQAPQQMYDNPGLVYDHQNIHLRSSNAWKALMSKDASFALVPKGRNLSSDVDRCGYERNEKDGVTEWTRYCYQRMDLDGDVLRWPADFNEGTAGFYFFDRGRPSVIKTDEHGTRLHAINSSDERPVELVEKLQPPRFRKPPHFAPSNVHNGIVISEGPPEQGGRKYLLGGVGRSRWRLACPHAIWSTLSLRTTRIKDAYFLCTVMCLVLLGVGLLHVRSRRPVPEGLVLAWCSLAIACATFLLGRFYPFL